MKRLLVLAIFATVTGLAIACTTNQQPSNTATTNTTSNTSVTTANKPEAPAKTEEETPAIVKSAFPDAQSFTKQHKDLTDTQIASIEKETGAKLPDKDHHSYLAFSTTSGARKQIGAATVVKANGKDVVIIYENKEGSPVIKGVRAEGVSNDFLKQFAGKGHDDKFQIGADLKANGADEAAAKAIAEAVRADAMTMQALYGASHSH